MAESYLSWHSLTQGPEASAIYIPLFSFTPLPHGTQCYCNSCEVNPLTLTAELYVEESLNSMGPVNGSSKLALHSRGKESEADKGNSATPLHSWSLQTPHEPMPSLAACGRDSDQAGLTGTCM